jgi:hypothetical protein
MEMPQVADPYIFRKASILDTPYLYELILQGSMEGSFTDRHFSQGGYARLLKLLLKALIKPPRRLALWKNSDAVVIVEYNGERIGFIHTSRQPQHETGVQLHIEHCTVATPFRNQGHGTRIIHWLISEAVTEQTTLTACCTKYARAMQHIFKKNHFERSSIGLGLDLYSLKYQSATVQTIAPVAHHSVSVDG